MQIIVEIPEDELKETVKCVVANKLYADYSSDRRLMQRVIAECIREIIYKDKAEIVDKIVARASRECKSKAVKKLLDTIGDD